MEDEKVSAEHIEKHEIGHVLNRSVITGLEKEGVFDKYWGGEKRNFIENVIDDNMSRIKASKQMDTVLNGYNRGELTADQLEEKVRSAVALRLPAVLTEAKDELITDFNTIGRLEHVHNLKLDPINPEYSPAPSERNKLLDYLPDEKIGKDKVDEIIANREPKDGETRQQARQRTRESIQSVRDEVSERQQRGINLQEKFFSTIQQNPDISKGDLIKLYEEDNLSSEEQKVIESVWAELDGRKEIKNKVLNNLRLKKGAISDEADDEIARELYSDYFGAGEPEGEVHFLDNPYTLGLRIDNPDDLTKVTGEATVGTAYFDEQELMDYAGLSFFDKAKYKMKNTQLPIIVVPSIDVDYPETDEEAYGYFDSIGFSREKFAGDPNMAQIYDKIVSEYNDMLDSVTRSIQRLEDDGVLADNKQKALAIMRQNPLHTWSQVFKKEFY